MKLLKSKQIRILLILFLLLPVMIFVSVNAGYTNISVTRFIEVILGGGAAGEKLVLLQFRLPRIVLAMLVGIGFSLSGCIIQGITKNALADPGLIGINSGASFVVVMFIGLSGSLSFLATFSLPFLSFIGAVITGTFIYILSINKKSGVNPMRLVLNGVAIQAGINACMTLLIINLDDSQFEFITKWQAGNIWGANWKMVISLLPWIIVGSIILLFNAKNLDILSMGDDISYGLGVAVSREKGKLLFTAIGLAAASVAISGSISFVGLIAPHLGRRLVGAKHKFLIPACSMIGALLVLSADTIARIIIMPSELPTGIVVSVLGAPYFIFLLIRSRNASKKTSGGNYETN